LFAGCKKDNLVRDPQDKLDNDTYWSIEKNVQTYAFDFYPDFFVGYGSSFTFGRYLYQGQTLNDDFGPTNPPQFTKIIPNSGGGWSFATVRRANIMVDRIDRVPGLSEESYKHWKGIARFFR